MDEKKCYVPVVCEGCGIDYSFEEQFTGKHWVDGKKIYQKTIQIYIDATPYVQKQTTHNISNVEQILDIQAINTDTNTSAGVLPFVYPYGSNNVTMLGCYADETYVYTMQANYGPGVPWTTYATIQYICTDR